MTFHEVLQFELWSKQTTRKILSVVGIGFVTVGFIVSIALAVESLWINPRERNAAKVALADVEDLQQTTGVTEDEFKIRKGKAESATERALNVAWTWRDQHISEALFGYQTLMEAQHDEPHRRAVLHEFVQKHPEYRRSGAQKENLSPQIIELIGKRLHGALD